MSNEQQAGTAVVEDGRNPFGGAPIVAAPGGGASAQALGQREVAEVQAALLIARHYPRDPQKAMDRILTNCTRLSLAEQATYQYARGGTSIVGPSIRLAEELFRSWGNMLAGVTELSRHAGYSECLAFSWDLETNARDERRFQVRHWRDTRQGGRALTDERDIYEVIANNGARRKRACILAVIPGDVVEKAVEQCEETLRTKVQVSQERITKMLEGFADFGVSKQQIEKRIQRRLDASIPPALFLQLARIYTSLKDEVGAVEDWFDTTPEPEAAGNGGGEAEASSVKDALKSRKQQAEPAAKAESKASDEKPAKKQEPAADAKKADPKADDAGEKEPKDGELEIF